MNTNIFQRDNNYKNLKTYESLGIKREHNPIQFKADTYNINYICNNLIKQSKQTQERI